jgi:hypothetical protein
MRKDKSVAKRNTFVALVMKDKTRLHRKTKKLCELVEKVHIRVRNSVGQSIWLLTRESSVRTRPHLPKHCRKIVFFESVLPKWRNW